MRVISGERSEMRWPVRARDGSGFGFGSGSVVASDTAAGEQADTRKEAGDRMLRVISVGIVGIVGGREGGRYVEGS